MHWYSLPYFFASITLLAVMLQAWNRRHAPGGRPLVALCLFASEWSACEGLLYMGYSLQADMLITQVQYLGIVAMPSLGMFFVISLFGPREFLRPWLFAAAAIVPLAMLVLVWTNSTHGLVFPVHHMVNRDGLAMMALEHGSVWYGFIIYNYCILVASSLVLLRQIVVAPAIHRGQAVMVFIGLGLTWAANMIYVTGNSPVPNMDLTPLAFAAFAGMTAWAYFRYRLLDVVPVAKSVVFNSLGDGILVLDGLGRILDQNPAAQPITGLSCSKAAGQPLPGGLARLPAVAAHLGTPGTAPSELAVESGGVDLTYELSSSELHDAKGRRLGLIMVFRDISRRKRLEEELKRLATTDPLTGINNRRSFMELGRAELARCHRRGHPMAVMMLDLDRFKDINDRMGHEVGDRVLQAVARLGQSQLRAGDVLGRVGGEEFAVILADASPDQAVHAAERLRQAVAGLSLPTSQGTVGVTVSLGLASLTDGEPSLEVLLRRADQALYQAKNTGRNRVVLWSPPAGGELA